MQTTYQSMSAVRDSRLAEISASSPRVLFCLILTMTLVICTIGRAEVRLERIGEPLWEIEGTGIFAMPDHIPVEDTNLLVTNTRELLSDLMGDNYFLSDRPLRYPVFSGGASEGPYDRLWREAVASAGVRMSESAATSR